MKNNTKIVIAFDFDGTLYSGKYVYCFVPEYVANHRREFLTKISDSEFEMICRENPDFVKAVGGADIVREIYKLKEKYPHLTIDTADFVACQERYIYDIYLRGAHFVDLKFISEICSKYPVYIVSNSSQSHIRHYMHVLGINPSIFKVIYGNKFEQFDPTKKHYYEEIIKSEGILPSNLFVFGDSISSDLEPAIMLGATGVHSVDAEKLSDLVYSVIKN